MSELIVVGFNDRFKAEEALLNLLKLELAHLASLEDAVIVVKHADGKIRVKAYHDLVKPSPELSNELWGGIISGVVFHRALQVSEGIFDEQFLINVEQTLKPNSSAIFLLVAAADVAKVIAELSRVDSTVIQTPLPDYAPQQIQDALV